jgi:hypothetical protein
MRAQLFMLGGLLLVVGSPAFAADWGDTAVRAATRMAIESDDRHREYDDRGGWVSAPATVGAWLGEGFGIALGLPIGVASFPVWLGVAAASEKLEAHQALQCSLLTGGAVYGAFASAGYHAVGAPLARVVGPGRGPANDGPDSRLPPSKLRP